MVTIWYTFDRMSPTPEIESEIREFPNRVTEWVPNANLAVERLPDEIDRELERQQWTSVRDILDDLMYVVGGAKMLNSKTTSTYSKHTRLFVASNPQHPAAIDGLWGVAIGGLGYKAALAWKLDRFLIWHEMLHLLQAVDCYDEETKLPAAHCHDPRCIMQFEPTFENVGFPPVLYETNQTIVEKFLSEDHSSG